MVESLIRALVSDVGHHERVSWAMGETVTVPASILSQINPVFRPGDNLRLPRDLPLAPKDCNTAVLLHAAFTPQKPISSRFPLPYHLIPPAIRTLVASFIGRIQRVRHRTWSIFPDWPLDLSSDFLSDLFCQGSPFHGPCPVILTHDIDSKEGLFNAIKKFLPIEESIGSRSVNYVVPFGWSLDRGMLDELVARGHELGIHGFDHANRTAFADLHELRKRIDAVRSLVECYGVRGYRAPSLLRTPELYFELKRLYRYDSSIPTSGGPFPCPNNGCASARPFDIGGISVLPISLPRDGSLRFLGYNPDDILKIWRDCAVRIARSGGVVVLLTHCEYRFSGNKKMFNIYRHFLEWISEEPAFRFATTDEIFNTMPLHKT